MDKHGCQIVDLIPSIYAMQDEILENLYDVLVHRNYVKLVCVYWLNLRIGNIQLNRQSVQTQSVFSDLDYRSVVIFLVAPDL